MRIVFVHNHHRGGGGGNNAFRATVRAVEKAGHEAIVFERSSADLPDGLRGRIAAAASSLYARSTVRAFADLLDRARPDVVHVHELFPLISPWILPACTRRGVPVVATCIDYRLTCPVTTHCVDGQVCTRCVGGHEHHTVLRNCRGSRAESVTMALYSTMTRAFGLFRRHVVHYIAPSDFTRRWLVAHGGIPERRISTVAPVVEAPAQAADPVKGSYIGYAGRLAAVKGITTLIDATRRSGVPVKLCRNAESLVTVETPRDIEVVVTEAREQLDDFYHHARAIVVPSEWFETFGLVGAEAMSHGVPVILSRIGAVECLIDEGVEGLCFTPGDAADLSGKMKRLWDDAELARTLGTAGRRKVLEQWLPEHHAQAHLAIYRRVCEAVGADAEDPTPPVAIAEDTPLQ